MYKLPDVFYPEDTKPERVQFIEDPRLTRREARIVSLLYKEPLSIEDLSRKLHRFRLPEKAIETDIEYLDSACVIVELTPTEYHAYLSRIDPTNIEIPPLEDCCGRYMLTRSGSIVHEAFRDEVKRTVRDWAIAIASSIIGGISGYLIGILLS